MDPAERMRRDILTVREDQRAAQQHLEEACAAEVSALHLLDSARAVQHRCRLRIEEDAQAISSLQDEIAGQVPRHRQPED